MWVSNVDVTSSSAGHQSVGNLWLTRVRSIIELDKMAVYLGVIWFTLYKSELSLPIYAYDYLAHWLWYWVTIPKVQGSNPGLTTNL